MNDFNSIEYLLMHLEKDAAEYRYAHQIGNLFNPLIEKYQKNGEKENEKKAQNEREIFFFEIGEGHLSPKMILTDQQGNPVPYPDITKFDNNSLEYIDSRLNQTTNPFLRARYSIALWESRKKHAKYARIAINEFLNLINIYSELDKKRPNDHFGLEVIESIKNAYMLAKQIKDKDKIDECKKNIVDLIKNYSWNRRSSWVIRKYLLEFMINEKFENDYFNSLDATFDTLLEKSEGQQKIMVLETMAQIKRKKGLSDKNELKLIAKEYEIMMNASIDNNPLASISFWEDALTYYKKIGDNKKVEELNNVYDILKKKAEYKEHGVKIDMTEVNKELDKIVEKITRMKKENIIKTLIGDKSILPDINVVKEQAVELANQYPLTRIFPITLLDEQGNVVQKFTSEEEKDYYGVLNNYRLHMEMINNLLINKIFTKLIDKNALTAEDIINYIRNNSWLGDELEKQSSKDIIIKYTWIDLISPCIIYYFDETKKGLATEIKPNYIMPLDSLVLKVEGLYRDLCRYSGIPTFYIKRIGDEQIIHEKDLNILLRENTLTLFSDDEIMLFKFVLIEKLGYNLRNKVAHSLMIPQDYNFTYMNLVLLIIMKFARFKK